MNRIAEFVKTSRRAAGLTQEEFAARSGLGLRFVRELEQGKKTVRMDKVNTALAMFNMEAVPGRIERKDDERHLVLIKKKNGRSGRFLFLFQLFSAGARQSRRRCSASHSSNRIVLISNGWNVSAVGSTGLPFSSRRSVSKAL